MKMPITRRDFLYLTGAVSAFGFFNKFNSNLLTENNQTSENLKYNYLIGSFSKDFGNSNIKKQIENYFLPAYKSQISIFNLNDMSAEYYDVPFLGHSFFQNSKQISIVAASEKWGLRAGAFDIANKKTLQSFSPPLGYRFFGHGVFLKNGTQLAFTLSNLKSGIIAIYDLNTGKLLDTFSSFGIYPHDCFLHSGGETLCVANPWNQQPSINYINLFTGNLIEKFDLPKYLKVSHLFPISDSLLLAGGRFSESGNGFAVVDTKLGITTDFSQKIKSHQLPSKAEALSLSAIDRNLVLSTTHLGKELIVWDFKNDRFIYETLNSPACGLKIIDQTIYLTTFDGNLNSFHFDRQNFKIEKKKTLHSFFSNVSHLLHV